MARILSPKSGRRLSSLIDEVFALHRGIRFVAIYQDQYIVAGGMRKGKHSLDPDEEAREIDLQLSRMGEIARTWQKWFGNLGTITLRYEKVNLCFQPISEDRFLVFSTDPGVNLTRVTERLVGRRGLARLAEVIP